MCEGVVTGLSALPVNLAPRVRGRLEEQDPEAKDLFQRFDKRLADAAAAAQVGPALLAPLGLGGHLNAQRPFALVAPGQCNMRLTLREWRALMWCQAKSAAQGLQNPWRMGRFGQQGSMSVLSDAAFCFGGALPPVAARSTAAQLRPAVALVP